MTTSVNTVDTARQALADQIVAIHMPEGSDAGAEEAALVIDQIISQMQASGSVQEALRKDANLRRMYDRLIADARTATLQVIRARAPQLRQATSVAYAATFTVSELQDLLVFFRTPTGQRFARSNVALLSAPSIVEWTQETDTQVQAQLEPILTRFGEEVSRAIAKTPQS